MQASNIKDIALRNMSELGRFLTLRRINEGENLRMEDNPELAYIKFIAHAFVYVGHLTFKRSFLERIEGD